jgi:CubicO group peptidase (beta-lactamase class C family)
VAAALREAASRHPAVGLAFAVVHADGPASFAVHGLAHLDGPVPVGEDTVFRIGSITKLFTAIAVMQLWERGRVDLDAPASEALKAFRLVPAGPGIGSPTIRHLMTHTSGIPDAARIADLLHVEVGPFDSRPPVLSVPMGAPLPSLAEHYRSGLRVVAEPGTAFAYSNPGYATLGQIVEDVSGRPLAAYLREHVFGPLGMDRTDLVRSDRIRERLATGYAIGRTGPRPVPDRDWIGAGGTGAYSTIRDLARFAGALLDSGRAGRRGAILRPDTLAMMLAPQYQPDARLPGMGLGFFRHDLGGHRAVGHDGILPGFHSSLLMAPDMGIVVIALTNGSPGAMRWLPDETARLLRRWIDAPEDAVRTDVPQRPDVWGRLCGRYRLPPRIGDLRGRIALAAGLEVAVRDGRLTAHVGLPIPGLAVTLPLYPDDPLDPELFRLDLGRFSMGTVRVAFAGRDGSPASAIHTDLMAHSLERWSGPSRPARSAPRVVAGLALGAAALAVRRRIGQVAGPRR